MARSHSGVLRCQGAPRSGQFPSSGGMERSMPCSTKDGGGDERVQVLVVQTAVSHKRGEGPWAIVNCPLVQQGMALISPF